MSEGILALEWSSRRLSAAWWRNGVIEERVVEAARFRITGALSLLEDCDDLLTNLTEVRIGCGPGNYTGVRQSLSWAIGFTAPGGVHLRAISSGRAQAERLLSADPSVAILGDARRGHWWGARFPADRPEWRLREPAAWRAEVAGQKVFSPEAERLVEGLETVVQDYPRASDLLAFPSARPPEDPAPCYLHPAV